MPSGLSSTIQPCTGSPRRLRRPIVVLLVLRGAEVARDFRLLQDFIDALRLVEGRIALELQARNEPQLQQPHEMALDERNRGGSGTGVEVSGGFGGRRKHKT